MVRLLVHGMSGLVALALVVCADPTPNWISPAPASLVPNVNSYSPDNGYSPSSVPPQAYSSQSPNAGTYGPTSVPYSYAPASDAPVDPNGRAINPEPSNQTESVPNATAPIDNSWYRLSVLKNNDNYGSDVSLICRAEPPTNYVEPEEGFETLHAFQYYSSECRSNVEIVVEREIPKVPETLNETQPSTTTTTVEPEHVRHNQNEFKLDADGLSDIAGQLNDDFSDSDLDLLDETV